MNDSINWQGKSCAAFLTFDSVEVSHNSCFDSTRGAAPTLKLESTAPYNTFFHKTVLLITSFIQWLWLEVFGLLVQLSALRGSELKNVRNGSTLITALSLIFHIKSLNYTFDATPKNPYTNDLQESREEKNKITWIKEKTAHRHEIRRIIIISFL